MILKPCKIYIVRSCIYKIIYFVLSKKQYFLKEYKKQFHTRSLPVIKKR